jgi:hypothetical protein
MRVKHASILGTAVRSMSSQVTRNNHYVPEWYQRGFLEKHQFQLNYLDMAPMNKGLPDGRVITMNNLRKRGPSGCFQEYDLYSTRFGAVINDEVEKFLFGSIDTRGAKAVRAFVSGDASEMHHAFQDFFEFIDAQKLRTPKGLDWIKARYPALDQAQLMIEMQGLRFMHCRMWTEGVREIVSAEDSDVKFIISDHPVTIFNAAVSPNSPDCVYPSDPPLEWIGSQTVFVLDANTCLILTHLEYAQDPPPASLIVPRTNARYRGSSLVRTDAFIRTRKLSRDEIVAINYLLKNRARKFLAASNRDWLFPERSFTGEWCDIAQILLPKDSLWRFGGEIYVGYDDGRSSYQDAFGRTSGADQYLRRKVVKADLRPNDNCGCGSGHKFKRCCQNLPTEDRPTWEVYSIRERNLMFCRAVEDILGLNAGKSWQDVQRELSDDQVKRIHEAFGSLWPEDTDLPSLLPKPRAGILRAVYLGISDPRIISSLVLGWLSYFDEIVLAHPFINPLHMRPEYSPTLSPSQHKEQTLKNVLLLFMLDPFIQAGYIHLIPNPGDFDRQFFRAILDMAKERTVSWRPSRERGGLQKAVADDDFRRMMLRRPEASLRSSIRREFPEASATQIDATVAYAKSQLEADPFALLQPVEPGEAGAQFHCSKGYNLEVAMFLASLTGSIIYTDIDAHWQHLHLHAQDARGAEDSHRAPVAEAFHTAEFPIQLDAQLMFGELRRGRFVRIKEELSALAEATQQQGHAPRTDQLSSKILKAAESAQRAWSKEPIGNQVAARIEVSIPANGFERNEVRRLLLTYGRAKAVHPIAVALRVKFEETTTS